MPLMTMKNALFLLWNFCLALNTVTEGGEILRGNNGLLESTLPRDDRTVGASNDEELDRIVAQLSAAAGSSSEPDTVEIEFLSDGNKKETEEGVKLVEGVKILAQKAVYRYQRILSKRLARRRRLFNWLPPSPPATATVDDQKRRLIRTKRSTGVSEINKRNSESSKGKSTETRLLARFPKLPTDFAVSDESKAAAKDELAPFFPLTVDIPDLPRDVLVINNRNNNNQIITNNPRRRVSIINTAMTANGGRRRSPYTLEFAPEWVRRLLRGVHFKVVRSGDDNQGNKVYRLVVMYKGIRVVRGDLVYIVFQNQVDDSIEGTLYLGFYKYQLPNVKRIDVRSIGERYENDLLRSIRFQKPAFEFVPRRTEYSLVLFIEPTREQSVRLAVEVKLYGEEPNYLGASRPYAIIDVLDEDTLMAFDALTTQRQTFIGGIGGNDKSGLERYDADDERFTIRVSREGTDCYYETENVITFKVNGPNAKADDKNPYRIPCNSAEKDPVNGAYAPVNDAHFNADASVQMLRDRYGALPYGEKPVRVRVRAGPEDRAMWNGEYIVLYDGDTEYHPMTSVDVVSHELAHMVIEESSQLTYDGESGGVNEAFADITGKMAEFWVKGLAADNNTSAIDLDWAIGADVHKDPRKALRYMDDPGKDGKSIRNYLDFRVGMDVHATSGILSHAFYLISTSPSFTVHYAYDMFYVANLYHWRSNTGFLQAAAGSLRALCELKRGQFIEGDFRDPQIEFAILAFQEVGMTCSTNSNGEQQQQETNNLSSCIYRCQATGKK